MPHLANPSAARTTPSIYWKYPFHVHSPEHFEPRNLKCTQTPLRSSVISPRKLGTTHTRIKCAETATSDAICVGRDCSSASSLPFAATCKWCLSLVAREHHTQAQSDKITQPKASTHVRKVTDGWMRIERAALAFVTGFYRAYFRSKPKPKAGCFGSNPSARSAEEFIANLSLNQLDTQSTLERSYGHVQNGHTEITLKKDP